MYVSPIRTTVEAMNQQSSSTQRQGSFQRTPDHTQQLSNQISSELLSRHSLAVSTQWLETFIKSIKTPPPPLPALISTAHFRILNSDFTHSLLSSPNNNINGNIQPLLLPSDIADVQIKSRTLSTNVPVQVLSIDDVGTSKWNQIEGIERVERGEEVRGREVIRSVPVVNDEGDDTSSDVTGSTAAAAMRATTKRGGGTTGPHKLLVQDAAGTKVYAFEWEKIPKIFITMNADEGGMSVGCKILLKRGTVVRRGMVMLRVEDVVVMGGKVDVWDKAWKLGRKDMLKDEIARQHELNDGDG